MTTAATAGAIRIAAGTASARGVLACLAGHRIVTRNGADGIYAGWTWNGESLDVHQDRYGFFPLFQSAGPEGTQLSTDLVQLLAPGTPRALDLDALAVFLRLGFFVGDDTPFTSIRAVLPPRHPVAPAHPSRRSAIEGFIDLLRQAVRRRLPAAPFVLPLSGGRDSRHILFELTRAGCPPARCVTVRHFPPRGNDDVEVAAALCERLRIPHVVLDQPGDRVEAERRKNLRTHLCTEEHAQFLVLADYLKSATAVTYDGIAGDVLSQSGYMHPALLDLFRRGNARIVAEFILAGQGNVVSEAALSQLVAPRWRRELARERAVARLEREVATHFGAVNPIASFYFWNRTRREIALAPFGLLRDIVTYAPYLDRDLFDFLASLPPELTIDRTLHSEAIAIAFPEHEEVGYERKTVARAGQARQRRLARALMRILAASGSRGLLNRRGLTPSLGWTAVTGSADRLWSAPFAIWLDQVAGFCESD